MSYQPLRDATVEQRLAASQISGIQHPEYVWIAPHTDGGGIFIVLPALQSEGLAISISNDGSEIWRKTAFYPELLGAGDGFQTLHEGIRIQVIAKFDGSWIPSVTLPNGRSELCEVVVFDSRLAIDLACDLADGHCRRDGKPATTKALRWGRVS